MTESSGVRRRTVLAGAGAAAGAFALAACSSGNDTAAPSGSGATSDTGNGQQAPLAQLEDIPVGGAVSAKDSDGKPILVAQPEAGTAVAFSAICTHQGCTVAPGEKELVCPCHGSAYDAASGEVLRGPAPRPLSEVPVHVEAGAVLPGAG